MVMKMFEPLKYDCILNIHFTPGKYKRLQIELFVSFFFFFFFFFFSENMFRHSVQIALETIYVKYYNLFF